MRIRMLLAALCAAALGCDGGGDDLIDIDGTGVVRGLVFRDLDASGDLGGADEPARNLSVALVRAGSGETVARTRTASDGTFVFSAVPVGSYEVAVPSDALGDSVRVVYRDPPGLPVEQIDDDDLAAVTVGLADTVAVQIGVGYFVLDIAGARALPSGRRVFVRGVASAVFGATGDTVHVQDSTHAIRATGAAGSGAAVGDSVLVLATTARRDGQPVLAPATVRTTGSGFRVDTTGVSAAVARTASGGRLDARLVRVAEVLVVDTSSSGGRFLMTVEDPSGSVGVTVPIALVRSEFVPGAEFTVTGVLVPRQGVQAVWDVRPRSAADIVRRP